MDPLDLPGASPPVARLLPKDLRCVADLVDRFATLGSPRLSVREALLGLAARAVHARRDAGQPCPSGLALDLGVRALDALLGEGMALFVREAEHNTDHMARATLAASALLLTGYAQSGRLPDEPPEAVPPDRPIEVLVTLPFEVVAWLRAEAQRRAGPPPGPRPEPSSVTDAGDMVYTQAWPTPDEEAARREHRERAGDIGSVIEEAVRGRMDT